MKISTLLVSLAATGAALGVSVPAAARQGCGIGFHRYHGRCYHNVRGRYYRGHGYWDGHRFYKHRYFHHGHWRYR